MSDNHGDIISWLSVGIAERRDRGDWEGSQWRAGAVAWQHAPADVRERRQPTAERRPWQDGQQCSEVSVRVQQLQVYGGGRLKGVQD